MWRDRFLVTSAVLLATTTAGLASAQDTRVHWMAAEKGSIPAEAIPLGREGDGRDQFVCRGGIRGSTQLGKIAKGYRGCNVSYQGRGISLSAYEVMVHGAVSVAETVHGMRLGAHIGMGAAAGAADRPARSPAGPPRDAGLKRGFDEKGQPYLEERRPDGTVIRYRRDGVLTTRPDGTSEFQPLMVARAEVQPATPPELPADPREGRIWMERHNAALLEVIGDLVQRDEGAMNSFFVGEQAAGNDDVFKQIAYRTTIADFLATNR